MRRHHPLLSDRPQTETLQGSEAARQHRRQSGVSLLVDEYDDDRSQLWWVRLDGSATIVETGPVWEGAVELLADKSPHYRGYPPDGAVTVTTVDRIVGWAAHEAT